MDKQGVLSYRIEGEPTSQNLTALSGLAAYLDLAVGSGLVDSLRRNMSVCGEQGWTDDQIVKSLVLLNLAGGDWAKRRMKAIRFGLINVPGRIFVKARQLYLRLSGDHPALELLARMRLRILELASGPPVPA